MVSRSTHYWLMKSEPSECSIDDALAAPGATVPWKLISGGLAAAV